MSTLKFLKNYSNYYNRRIIRENIDNYESETFTNINFNPNDDLVTEQIINWNNNWTPDYMVDIGEYIIPDPVVEHFDLFHVVTDTNYYFDTIQELVNADFYNTDTKVLSLSNIGNYHNLDRYGSVNLYIEGSWLLDAFSFKINVPNGLYINFWADYNNISTSINGEVVINKDWLLEHGWQATGEEGDDSVWGIHIWAGSPDTFYGTIDFNDYTGNANKAIKSRWFVMDWTRTRKGQYKANLKKDVISDNYNAVINAPMFINKATIANIADPAVFNKEDIKVNQIKKSEYPVVEADASNGRACPINWIVGYATKQESNADAWTEEDINTPAITNEYSTWSDFPLNSIITQTDGNYTALRTEARYVGAYVGATGSQVDNGWVAEYAYEGYSNEAPTCPKTYK